MADRDLWLATFDEYRSAAAAVAELRGASVPDDHVHLVVRDPVGAADVAVGGTVTDNPTAARDPAEAVRGATAGMALGAGLGALATVLLPGIGPVLVGGILAAAVGFGAAGAAVGGLLGSMHGLELSEEDARQLEAAVHGGRAVVTVRDSDSSSGPTIQEVLRRCGGHDVRNYGPVPPAAVESAGD